jgi:hypothetical protein
LASLDQWEPFRRRLSALREPAEGSRWADDLRLKHGEWVRIYAGHALSAGVDHLRAWAALSRQGQTIYAPWALARGAIEGAVRASWHVTPDSTRTRVARAYAARRHDQDERRKFSAPLAAKGLPSSGRGKTAVERIAEVDRDRDAAGLEHVGYRDTTSLVREAGLEALYRVASGYTHGLEWMLASASMRPVEAPRQGLGLGGVFTPDERYLLALAVASARQLRSAIDDLEVYAAGR